MTKNDIREMVYNANTLEDIEKAEKILLEDENVDVDEYDEYMKALSYVSREIYRN